MADLRDEITEKLKTMERLFAARDVDSLKTLYTEDVKAMPPDRGMLTGIDEAVPLAFNDYFAGGAASMHVVADEVGPLGDTGDMVYTRGHHTFAKADGSEYRPGKHVMLWKKTSEGYKIYTVIYNDKI